jgi:hypothetical protein
LPHYGKYSVLGFSGAEAINQYKGQWASGDGSWGGIVIVGKEDSAWSGGGSGCASNYYLTLQAYNNDNLCYVSQEILLKSKKYILSFMGRSRGGYTQSELYIKIDSEIEFIETLSYTWTKYTILYHSTKNKIVDIAFINDDNDNNFASQISCVELVEA